MNKLPALQFYPGDWWRDLGVLSLNCEERGAWFQILLLMHDSERKGLLLINGQPPTDEMLSNVLGLEACKVRNVIQQILSKGVASLEQTTGALVCRRMFHLHEIRSAAGRKSRTKFKQVKKQDTGPSISFSISTSKSKVKIEELCVYFLERGSTKEEAEKFFDYYTANGWKVGRSTMKDWRAAARNWVRRNSKPVTLTPKANPVSLRACYICGKGKMVLESEWTTHMQVHEAERKRNHTDPTKSLVKDLAEKLGEKKP